MSNPPTDRQATWVEVPTRAFGDMITQAQRCAIGRPGDYRDRTQWREARDAFAHAIIALHEQMKERGYMYATREPK